MSDLLRSKEFQIKFEKKKHKKIRWLLQNYNHSLSSLKLNQAQQVSIVYQVEALKPVENLVEAKEKVSQLAQEKIIVKKKNEN